MKRILLLFSCLLLGGCAMMANQLTETRKVNEYVLTDGKFKELQDKLALEIVNTFENVRSIQFKKLTISPMGRLWMEAIVNDNNDIELMIEGIENPEIYIQYNPKTTVLIERKEKNKIDLGEIEIVYGEIGF